jgi:hypothetical protein
VDALVGSELRFHAIARQRICDHPTYNVAVLSDPVELGEAAGIIVEPFSVRRCKSRFGYLCLRFDICGIDAEKFRVPRLRRP